MQQTSTPPRIKIDLTQNELIAESPEERPIRHFYSDAPQPPVSILCYSVNEILAEKTRALCERQGRARDLYDVVNIIRNFSEQLNLRKASDTIRRKFTYKLLQAPTVESILKAVDSNVMQANWAQQLRHQLPTLPPVMSYLEELRSTALKWVVAAPVVERAPSISSNPGEQPIPRSPFPQLHEAGIPRGAYSGGILDSIRYAARNRLCVEIYYHGGSRLMEPYSLRMPKTGNLLLYAFELSKGGIPTQAIKAYKVAEIQASKATETAFRPRFIIEL